MMTAWPEFNENDKRISVPEKFAELAPAHHISSVFADLKSSPSADAGLDTQLIHGENIIVLREEDEWVQVQSTIDHYVGWTLKANISQGVNEATHLVCVPRTFYYPEPDMKKPRVGYLGLGSRIVIVAETETRGTHYKLLGNSHAIISDHAHLVTAHAADYVTVAESLLRTPYLWGGSTSFGIDCSGLVQLSMRMAGIYVLRDSDMQAATIGSVVDVDADYSNVERGDLVFWIGHVGICQGLQDGEQYLIHANGHTMDVTSEPLLKAIERIEFLYERPIGVRRPDGLST